MSIPLQEGALWKRLRPHQPTPANHLPYDATYGYTLERLLTVEAPEPPPGFEAFWQQRLAAALAIDPALQPESEAVEHDGFTVQDVAYRSTGGTTVKAWLVEPVGRPVRRIAVVGHGYGSRTEPDAIRLFEDAAYLYPCVRGLGSETPGMGQISVAEHVLHGIESRETYVHGGCVDDFICGASALLERHPGLPLFYDGGSFGGGIGALLLAWDRRFLAGALRDPSFGVYPLRVTQPCSGSGHYVTTRYQHDPQVLEVLRYFDSATAARWIEQPVIVTASLFDPAVPPPGQFAVFNAIPGDQKRLLIKTAGHFEYPGIAEEERIAREAKRLFLTPYL